MTDEKTRALIAEAREWESDPASWGDNGLVTRLADALAAQPVLDPEKAVKIVDAGIAEYLREDLPEDGFNEAEVIARALCEAAKRGELT